MVDQVRGPAHRSVAADDDNGVQPQLGDVLEAAVGDVLNDRFTVLLDWVARWVALVIGPEDGASERQDVGDITAAYGSRIVKVSLRMTF